MAHGEIVHFDIPSDDMDWARRFYRELFGWTFDDVQGFADFAMTRAGAGDVTGGLGKRGVTAPEGLRIYVNVDSIDEAIARLPDLGGSVVVEKTEVPGQGWYAAINDSEGTEIGIWENPAG